MNSKNGFSDEEEFSYSGYEDQSREPLRGTYSEYDEDGEYSYGGYEEHEEEQKSAGLAIAEAVSYGDFLVEEYSVQASVKRVGNDLHLPKKVVTYLLAAAYLVIGVLCLVLTEQMVSALSYIVGTLMIVVGVVQFAFALRSREFIQTSSNKTAGSLIIIALAVMILVEREWAESFIPIVWGIIGLVEAAHAFNHALSRIARGMRASYYMVKGIIEAVLAFLLLYEPAHHITLHLIVFGIQLIFDGITMLPALKGWLSKG